MIDDDVIADDGVLEAYKEVRRSLEKRRAQLIFIAHLGAYVIGNIFLGGWNILTYFVKDSETLWFFIPLLFWGVGVIIHYLQSVALFDEWWDVDERTIESRKQG